MTLTIETILAAIGIALTAMASAVLYIRVDARRKLALARVDLASYVAGAGSVLALVPEGMELMFPKMMSGDQNLWALVTRFDVVAFVLVSASLGAGVARRWMTVATEKKAA